MLHLPLWKSCIYFKAMVMHIWLCKSVLCRLKGTLLYWLEPNSRSSRCIFMLINLKPAFCIDCSVIMLFGRFLEFLKIILNTLYGDKSVLLEYH